MKIFKSLTIFFFLAYNAFATLAQGYNQQKNELSHFLERMYESQPFEGVKVFTDYENTYLLSVVVLDPYNYSNNSIMTRVASVKAMSQANTYINGAHITSECIISNVKKPNGVVEETIADTIIERGAGYVKQMELLTNFSNNGRNVYIYATKMEVPSLQKRSKRKK